MASCAIALVVGVLQPAMPAYASGTFVVNSTTDAVDSNVGDQVCATAAGDCTLRAAVQEANFTRVSDSIQIPAGTYRLTIQGDFPGSLDPAASEDLDITAPLTISGSGSGETIIEGGPAPEGAPAEQTGMSRLLMIHPSAGSVSLSGLGLTKGWSPDDGGAILNEANGSLRLTNVTVAGNTTESEGGGIYHRAGALYLTDTILSENTARGGGGLYSAGESTEVGVPGRATLLRTTLKNNTAATGGGLLSEHESRLEVTDSIITGNHAESYGGGMGVTSKATFIMSRGEVEDNTTPGDGAGVYADTEGSVSITGTHFLGNAAGVAVEGEIPEGAGGGLSTAGMGAVTISNVRFERNRASGEGGGYFIGNSGSVSFTDASVKNNKAAAGGGIENAGARVNLERLDISGNDAELDGGGIHSQGSGNFTITDTTIRGNSAENGGGLANEADGTLRVQRSSIYDNKAVQRFSDDTGLGGGIYSLGDASATYENITLSSNLAQVRGGGIFVDADAPVHINSSTIAHNASPIASGIGGEIGSPNVPIQPSPGVILQNTLVAANKLGPNCSFAVGSEGGNLDDGDSCYFRGDRDRQNARTVLIDAIADNGGATPTMALNQGSLAIDNGVAPGPRTDQRGVERPLNTGIDTGAYEYEGPFDPEDNQAPTAQFIDGPVQDTESTSLFRFTGSDDQTAVEDLRYECRLIESDPTEPVEPADPTQPVDPEFMFVGCSQPWQVPLIEDGSWTFEFRAIDRAGNVGETVSHAFTSALDVTAPETVIVEHPEKNTSLPYATFSFTATDNATPVEFIEFECRIDSGDPAAWLECTNPATYSNLIPGEHTFQVRATDSADNIDASPATYTWTVGTAEDCDLANITLLPSQDTWVDEALGTDNFGVQEELVVRSGRGSEARTLISFALPELPDCELESATLRLFGEGDSGRTLEAVQLDGGWTRMGATWLNQPSASGSAALTGSGAGYNTWNVTTHVEAYRTGEKANNGWVIRDAGGQEEPGTSQSFLSSRAVREPATPPQLVLRFEPAGTEVPPAPIPASTETTVVCGQVIKESLKLANDLRGCMGEGLVIGAPNLDVDLNGHVIASGLVVAAGQEEGMFAGIRNSGHSNVSIHNGTIENFGHGVRLLPGTTHNKVSALTLQGNIMAGVELFDADNGRIGNTVTGNTFRLNGDGVTLLEGAEASQIVDNYFVGNLGRAVHAFDARGHVIKGNTVSGDTGDPLLDSDGGISLESSMDNLIQENTLTDAGDAAILLTNGSHGTRIVGNTASRTSDSAASVSDSNGIEISGNTFHQAGGAAIVLDSSNGGMIRENDVRYNPGGIELVGANDNLIELNDARQTQADGISLEASFRNEIKGNRVSHTGGNGISVEAEALNANGDPVDGNTITGNEANGNGATGISVVGGAHAIGANQAYNNLSWGIEADAGSVDLGGNKAAGNAEAAQCVGVSCDTSGPVPDDLAPDLEAPDTAILEKPLNGGPSMEPQTFSFLGVDNQAPATALRYECRLDAPPDPEPEAPEPPEPGQPVEPADPPASETWSECGTPLTYNAVLSGEHTFEVRAIDPSDNVDLTPATYTWTLVPGPEGPDTVAPRTTISDSPGAESTSTTAKFSFRGTDNTTPGEYLTYQCRLDDGVWSECASPAEFSGLSLGAHTFAVRAIDLQGNQDATPATHTWTITEVPEDTLAPDTAIQSGPDRVTVETSAEFGFSSTEAGAVFECSLDGAAWEECVTPATLTTVAVGAHTFAVRAVDAAGNVDESPAIWPWTVGASPVPTELQCGATVTHSVKLTGDLLDCVGDALIIGASAITVDLDGHLVDGAGIGAGILIANGFDNVTVTGGTVQEFEFGVGVQSVSGAIVDDMTVQLNTDAGVLFSGAGADGSGAVRHSVLTGNGVAVRAENGTRGTSIHDNTFSGNAGQAVYLLGAHENTVERNDVPGATGDGIILLEHATQNTVRANTVTAGSDAAITLMEGSNDNLVEANYLTNSEAGIDVDVSHGNRIIANTVHGMSDSGIVLEEADGNEVIGNDVRFNSGGIEVSGSSGNLIKDNRASDTPGYGIELGDGSFRNRVVGNQANDNDAAGISVGGAASAGEGNLIEGNTANGNTGDGLSIEAVGHMIRNNLANHNVGWGIYSSAGTPAGTNLDGGGNRASGNAGGDIDPATGRVIQCYNINCDGGAGLAQDRVGPDTTILSGPQAETYRTDATFSIQGTDNASAVTLECRLDGGQWTECESPASFTGLALGAHSFEVRATDWSGNVDQTPAVHSWTIIEPPADAVPTTTILSGPDGATDSTTAEFTFESDLPGVSFVCTLDSGTPTDCQSPVTFAGLSEGNHTFEVYAVAGVPGDPATLSWTISGAPVPTAVTCGQTITTSIALTNDLADCSGDALIIGAGGITLDLAGHTLAGIGIGAGVRNDGFDQIAVRGGTITGFDHGVLLSGGIIANTVSGLTLTLHQEAAIAVRGGQPGTVLRQNDIRENSEGIQLAENTRGAKVTGNNLSSNAGNGIVLDGASENSVLRNNVSESSGAGIALLGAIGNSVRENRLTGNSSGGISIDADLNDAPSVGNSVGSNTVTISGSAGITVISSVGTQLTGNTVNGNSGPGVDLDGATDTVVRGNDLRSNDGGISLNLSQGSLIEANNASTANGTGISVAGDSFSNTIKGNTLMANSGGGLDVSGAAQQGQGNVIEANNAGSNQGDGISVADAGHTVTGNYAFTNDGWGIYANEGVTDGGGNKASGNAEPAQCYQIVCEIIASPSAPDTKIVEHPAETTNSQRALFTFTGTDDATATANLGFQCRLDSSDELAWIDCENPWEFNVAAGRHTFEVRAVDDMEQVDPTPAVFTWTYQPLPSGVAPDTTIDQGPEDSPSLEALFLFSSNEPDVQFECSLDGAPYTPCELGAAAEYQFEETEVGSHTFRVRAIDTEGNVDQTPAEHTWVITGIVTTVTNGPAYIPGEGADPAEGGETEETSATFEFESNVADPVYRCSIDLGAFTACSSPVTYSELGPGEHVFRVYAIDSEGAEQIEPTEYGWTVLASLDTVPPNTAITTPANAIIDPNGSVTFAFSGTDNATSPNALMFECSLNDPTDAGFFACESPVTFPSTDYPEPLAPGVHTFYVRAIDAEDNIDPDPAWQSFTFDGDTTAPETTVTSGPGATTTSTEVTVRFNSNDPYASFECALDTVDGAPLFEECASPNTVSADAVGEHTLLIRSVDLAGNIGNPAEVNWILQGAPTTTFSTEPAAQTGASAVFEFTSNVTTATFECQVDAGPFQPCASPWTVENLASGSHEVQIRAVADGFTGQPVQHTWTVDAAEDTTAPDTTIHSGPEPVTTATSATFTFSSTDPGAGFRCTLDTNEQDCTSPYLVEGLAEGVHTLVVRAMDASGNVDPVGSSWTWEVDGPPAATITEAPAESTASTTATFRFVSDEPGSTFTCWYAGPGQTVPGEQACDSGAIEYTNLAVGNHTFAVKAKDAQGNEQAEWVEHEWIVVAADTAAPETSGDSGQPSGLNPTFDFSSEPGATFECSLDSAPFNACVSPVTHTVEPGAHTFAVRATDASGNTDPTPFTWTWTASQPETCTTSALTLNTNADSWFNQDNQSEAKGTDSNLKVMSGSGKALRAIVGFAEVPEGCVVEQATLRMYAKSYKPGRTLEARPVTGAWTEGGVNWANQPATGTATATATAKAGWIEWNVTSAVQAGSSGFLVKDAAESSGFEEQQFNSREAGSDVPQLVLTLASATAASSPSQPEPVTEPATEPQPVTEPVAEPQPVTEPVAEPQPVTEPATEPQPQPEPVAEPQPQPEPAPAPVDCGPIIRITTHADTWVEQKDRNKNYGTDSALKLRAKSGEAARVLTAFALPKAPAGCHVASAQLQLNAGSEKTGRSLEVMTLANTFAERSATWANQPATSGGKVAVPSARGWLTWQVTGLVQAKAASTEIAFVVKDANEGSGDAEQAFSGRENGKDLPVLIITYAAD